MNQMEEPHDYLFPGLQRNLCQQLFNKIHTEMFKGACEKIFM